MLHGPYAPSAAGTPPAQPQLLSAAAAEALGLRPATIRAWILRRKLPVVRVGRAVRIPAGWIADYIAANTTPALPERGARW